MSTISKVALYSLIAVGLSLFGTLIYFINSPKYVKSYYLKSNSSIPAIGIEIENASDETIFLSREVSWPQAVQMVDSLNKTIPNR
jgi:hypothetical protein